MSSALDPIKRRYLAFWDGPAVSPTQVARFRLIFFALLAIDAFLLIGHAARYGAGDFNVAQFPALPAPSFDRTAIVVCALVMTYLAARLAIGGARRWMLIFLTAVYSAVYLSSQLDSYQHHFLLALMLVSLSMVDWRAAETEGKPGVAMRLLFIQVSVVYLFAAISKMDPAWWDGRALEAMTRGQPDSIAIDAMRAIGFSEAAKLTVLTELFLAVAIHIRRLRIPAAAIGIALHIGIELADFKIGLFSYYMIGFYLLVLPPWMFRWSAVRLPKLPAKGSPIVWMIGSVAGGVALIATLGLDGGLIAAGLIAAFGLSRKPRRADALKHLVAALVVVACAFFTDAIRDHYRYWGGHERRFGNLDVATHAYERLVRHEPSYTPGRRNLGKLYLAESRFEDALAQYKAAQTNDPGEAATELGIATVYLRLGKREDALYHAARAKELAPMDDKLSTSARSQVIKQATAIEQRFRRAPN